MSDLQEWLKEAEWAKKWGTHDRNVRMEEAVAALRAVVELCDNDGRYDVTGDEMAGDILRAIEKEVLCG